MTRLLLLLRLLTSCLALVVIQTPFGRYEMKQCASCSALDRLALPNGVSVAFTTWWPPTADADALLHSPKRVDSLVLLIAGGGQRLPSASDMIQRLFEAFASHWVGESFVVVAPVLPLLSGGDLATFADDSAAAQLLAAFCSAIARQFGTAGCHVVGLSNGGIAGIQLAMLHPAPVLSLTLFATAVLEDHDLEAIRRGNALCRIPVCLFVGTRDVPFHDAAIDMVTALEQACGRTTTAALHELNSLRDVHHWNIIEEVMCMSKRGHFRFLDKGWPRELEN